MGYISHAQLAKLKEYKYSGVDHSLVSRYVLKPFYNQFIKLFPLSIACVSLLKFHVMTDRTNKKTRPNLITLSGFGFVIVNFLTLLWYNPTLDQDCPPWVYATWSIGLFLYQTFDAVDGSQARRTGQSGPLGELFDHSVDALNTFFEVLLFAGCMTMGQGWLTMLVLFASLFTFYVQTWDEYHTKTLTLGIISGPVEGVLTLATVYGITAYIGYGSFWRKPMLATLGVSQHPLMPDLVYKLAWNEWYMVYGCIVLVLNTYWSAANVMKHLRKEGKQSPSKALVGLWPFLGRSILIAAYLYLQPSILRNHLVPFVFFAGLVNAYAVGQIITAHLVKGPFPYKNVIMWPLFFGVGDSLGPVLQQRFGIGWPSVLDEGLHVSLVFAMVGFAVGIYGSFVVDIIGTICEYLDIWCLTIKHPQKEKSR